MIASIPGFPGYFASDDGEILSSWKFHPVDGWTRGEEPRRSLKAGKSNRGYLSVVLRDCKGKRRTMRVNRLVLMAFIGPPPDPEMDAAHEDNARSNNSLSNLRWATKMENSSDKVRHGTVLQGRRNPNAKLDETAIRQIRSRHASGEGSVVLSRVFGVSSRLILDIAKRKAWKWVN